MDGYWSAVERRAVARSDCQRALILQIMYVVLGYPMLRRAVNGKAGSRTRLSPLFYLAKVMWANPGAGATWALRGIGK